MSAKRVRGSLKQDGTTIVLKNGATDEATLSKGANTSASNFVLPAYNGTDSLVSQNSTDTLANKTIDGDQNTVQDLALTSLKTEAGSPNQVLRRNVSGTVVADKTAPTGDFVGTTDSQTVTNKTIDADNNLISNIGDSEIAAAAAISLSKLAALTASRALQTGAGGVVEASTVTSAELGQLSGLSSNIQTQINAKVAKAGDTMTGFLTLSADPTSALHAATKAYADALSNGLRWKTPVRVASTAAVSIATGLENGDTVDGVVLATGDRVLLKNQAPSSDNGIYVVVVSGAASRAADAATATDLTNAVVFVDQGTANANRGYIQTDTLTTLADPQTWTQNFGASLYVADGDGLQLSGNVFSLELDGSTLSKSASGLKVATNGVTNNEVATGIAATKLADGSVDNTEFQRLGTAGTAGSGNLITTDGTQALTNKDYDGGVASNARRLTLPSDTKTNLDALTRKEGTLVYATDLDKVFFDNGTTLVEVGSGSGQGELNNITNSSVSTDTTGWFAQGTTTAVRQSTGGPLDPLIPTALRIDAGSATNYVRYRWTMPSALKQRKLKWEWFQRPEGTNGNEWKVEVHTNTASDYTGTDAELALSTDSSGDTLLPAATGKFTTTFDADASDYYEIRYIRVTGSDYLDITNVIVGPGIQPQGAVVEEWKSFTPTWLSTGTAPTFSANAGKSRRVGDTLELEVNFTTLVSSASTGEVEMTLPYGLTVDTTKITAATASQVLGTATFNDVGVAVVPLSIRVGNTSAGVIFIKNVTGTADTIDWPEIGNSDQFGFRATLPIAEWAGAGTVNLAQNDVQFAADDGAADVFGPEGALVPNVAFATGTTTRSFSFQTPPQTSDLFIVELSEATGRPFSDVAARYPYMTGNNAVAGNVYGVRGRWSSATQYDVTFGQQGDKVDVSNVSNGTTSWATLFAAGARFRVRKISGGNAVGFGEVAQNSSGLVKSAGQLKGTNTNDSAATGYVGEYVAAVLARSSRDALVSGTAEDLSGLSITLTAGHWKIGAVAGFLPTAGTTITQLNVATSTTSATMPSVNQIAISDSSGNMRTTFSQASANNGGLDVSLQVPDHDVKLTATTTFYPVVSASFSGTLQAWGQIYAWRVR
jgi:hypothetical protein